MVSDSFPWIWYTEPKTGFWKCLKSPGLTWIQFANTTKILCKKYLPLRDAESNSGSWLKFIDWLLIILWFSIRLGFLWFGYGLKSLTLLTVIPNDIVATIYRCSSHKNDPVTLILTTYCRSTNSVMLHCIIVLSQNISLKTMYCNIISIILLYILSCRVSSFIQVLK